jgi:hypothetical protein
MKKKLPLTVLESLEKFVQLNGEQFEIHAHEKFMLSLSDNDKNSDFFFNIEECKNENGLKLLIGWKPINKDNIISKRMWIDCKDLEIYFNNWIIVLKGYEKVNSFFDDPILNSYAEDYYSEFIIVDEDLETIPFKPQQILMLDAHLETIEDNIEKYKTEVNNEQIEMTLSWNEIKDRALNFSKEWADTSNEEADAKPFLVEFFNVFGISSKRVSTFEHRVKKLDEKMVTLTCFGKERF